MIVINQEYGTLLGGHGRDSHERRSATRGRMSSDLILKRTRAANKRDDADLNAICIFVNGDSSGWRRANVIRDLPSSNERTPST